MSFKDNLRNELIYNDIEIKELAYRINIPYSTLLSYVNKQSCTPSADVAVKIAKVLNVSVEYLVTGKDNELLNVKFPNMYVTMKELQSLPENVRELLQQLIHMYSTQTKKESFIDY